MSFDPNEPDVWGRTGQAKVDAAKQRGENVPEGFDYSRFDLSKALDTQGPSMPNLFPTPPASYSGSDTSPSHYSELDISPSRYSRSDTSPPGIALSFFIVILAFFFGGLQAALTFALLILGLWLAFLLLKLVFTLVRAILSFVFSWKGVLLGCFAFGGFFIFGPASQLAPSSNMPFLSQGTSTTNSLALDSSHRWLIIASRPTLGEAASLASQYKGNFPYTGVLLSQSGWYAVTVGNVEYPLQKYLKDKWISENLIPNDSFFATGTKFTKQVSW